jgi:aminoglycoside phosphotransferase (APT) family kinase protein
MATAKENERMYRDVRRYLKFHFDNGRTLEQLQNIGDEQSNPELAGQHQSVRIVRLPIPATEDGLFVIKNLGSGGEYPRNARDLFAEASAMELVGTYTKIPVPKVYYACRADEKDPQLSFIAMEYVKGEAYKKSLRLTRSQRISIIRQMAIIRIEMIKVMSALIGSVEYPMTRIKGNIVDPNFLNPAGEMVGPEVSAEGRVRSKLFPRHH